MIDIALIDSDVEAFGHPANCTEPASGSVVSTSTTGITVTVDGTTKEMASIDSADINIPSHSHTFTEEDGCTDTQSHTIDPDTGEPTITINGSPVYLVEDAVTTDPTSGGDVDITTNSLNSEITKT